MKILVDGLGKYRKERWREKLMIYTTWENPLATHLNELLAQSGEETYIYLRFLQSAHFQPGVWASHHTTVILMPKDGNFPQNIHLHMAANYVLSCSPGILRF